MMQRRETDPVERLWRYVKHQQPGARPMRVVPRAGIVLAAGRMRPGRAELEHALAIAYCGRALFVDAYGGGKNRAWKNDHDTCVFLVPRNSTNRELVRGLVRRLRQIGQVPLVDVARLAGGYDEFAVVRMTWPPIKRP